MWLLLVLAGGCLIAMEQEATHHEALQCLRQLKPFSDRPIKDIPRYLFENCNQGVCFDWPDKKFEKLRAASRTASREKLLKAHKGEIEAFTKNAEAYDWISGLEYLQSIDTSRVHFVHWLTPDRLVDINRRFSRLVNPDSRIRKEKNCWFDAHAA